MKLKGVSGRHSRVSPPFHAALCTGATFLTPYKREGNLIWPTLLDNVTPDMRIAWEEPFGPVIPIMRVDNVEQAVQHCNANRLALQVRAVISPSQNWEVLLQGSRYVKWWDPDMRNGGIQIWGMGEDENQE